MTGFLDELYDVLMGFGVKRTYIDYGLGAVLSLTDGLALRGVVDDVRRPDAWAFAVGVGWLTFVCWRYMTSKGGAS